MGLLNAVKDETSRDFNINSRVQIPATNVLVVEKSVILHFGKKEPPTVVIDFRFTPQIVRLYDGVTAYTILAVEN